jgi:hypothetical protein
VLEVFLPFTQSVVFLLVFFPILVYLAGEKNPVRYSISLIPRGVTHTFAPLPKLERPSFTPDGVTRVSSGRWSDSSSVLKAGLLFELGFLPVWRAMLQIVSQAFSRFLCATET